jgi:hypothetical protein
MADNVQSKYEEKAGFLTPYRQFRVIQMPFNVTGSHGTVLV